MKKRFGTIFKIFFALFLVAMTVRVNTLSIHAEDVTVTGTVDSKTTTSILYLNTSGGTMEIKLDSGTDYSQCRVLITGQKVSVTIHREDDAYNHASKIVSGESTTTVANAGTVTNCTNVTGTVASKTTNNTLYLNTSGGQMEIKIDSNTDATNCRALTEGMTVTAAVYRGDDAVMHAAKLTGKNAQETSSATVDKNNSITVSGTVSVDSTSNWLYLKTNAGTMQIAMDSTASIGSKILVTGDKVTCVLGYGSDATWHLVSSSGSFSTVSSGTGGSACTLSGDETTINGQTMKILTGTATDQTNTDYFYLKAKDGTFQLKSGTSCDVKEARVAVPGETYKAAVYYSDGYWCAAKISATKATNSTASVDSSKTATVVGTVGSNSTADKLMLKTNGGTMEIRLDSTTSYPGILYYGETVGVYCGYGSDATWHAINITK